ncbi:MAG: type I 3-dehydroquinate dehydratase [Thermoplasmata archaeon]
MKICACISGKTAERCTETLKRMDTEMIEHRMDFMDSIEDLEGIYGSTEADIIATNRRVDEGGFFNGTEDERIGYLTKAVDAGCHYVDVELETEELLKAKVMEYAKDNGCKVILSKHDFNKTPLLEDLIEIMERQKMEGADIGKIVTYANNSHDCYMIFDLLIHAEKEGFELVAFAMGDLGRNTRVLAPMYGAPFMYACVADVVADGQFDVETLRNIWRDLDVA